MKVESIIAMLQECHKMDDELLISYWDMSYVEDTFDSEGIELTKKIWLEVVAEVNKYTKHNELSGSLIEEAASDVVSKYIDKEESK